MEGGLQGPGGQLPGSGLLPATRHTNSVDISGGSERTIDSSSADQVGYSSTLDSLLVYVVLMLFPQIHRRAHRVLWQSVTPPCRPTSVCPRHTPHPVEVQDIKGPLNNSKRTKNFSQTKTSFY